MGFMDGFLKVLGFETNNKPKKEKGKTASNGAEYNLNDDKPSSRPVEIDGVKVFYPERETELNIIIKYLSEEIPVILNFQGVKEYERLLAYVRGMQAILGGSIKEIGSFLFLILPAGVSLENE